jgi:hypothetical protein
MIDLSTPEEKAIVARLGSSRVLKSEIDSDESEA